MIKSSTKSSPKKKNNIFTQSLCVVLITAMLLTSCFYEPFPKKSSRSNMLVTFLNEKTKPDDDVLFIGNACAYYLISNRFTRNKYFYQIPPIAISDDLYEDFMIEVQKKPSDYVICFGDRSDNYKNIDNIDKNHEIRSINHEKGMNSYE